MNMKFIIRPAQESDVPELLVLHREILKLEGISHLISDGELKSWYSKESLPRHMLLLVNNKIISHIEVIERHFSYDGIVLKCGELSSVHTHPSYRGKGYGLILLYDVYKYMKKNKMTFSMVNSGVKHFYQSGGYELFPLVVYPAYLKELTNKVNKINPDFNFCKILPYDKKYHGELIYEFYKRTNILIPLEKKFSKSYWQNLKSDEDKNYFFWIVKKGGDIVGFLGTEPFPYYADDLLRVDILTESPEENYVLGLLLKFIEKFKDTKFSRIVISINEGKDRSKKIENFLRIQPVFQSSIMFKIIDFDGLIKQIIPAWSEKIKRSKLSFHGRIEIECLGRKVRINVGDGKIALDKREYNLREIYLNHLFEREKGPTIYLPLSQSAFLSLLFGVVKPGDLKKEKFLYLNKEKISVLQVIFGKN